MSRFSTDSTIKVYQSNSILNSKPKHVVKGYGQNSSRSSSILSKGFVPSASSSSSSTKPANSIASTLGISKKRLLTSSFLVIPDSPIKGDMTNTFNGENNHASFTNIAMLSGDMTSFKSVGRAGGSFLPPSKVRKFGAFQTNGKKDGHTEEDDEAIHRKREREFELEIRNRKSAKLKAKLSAHSNVTDRHESCHIAVVEPPIVLPLRITDNSELSTCLITDEKYTSVPTIEQKSNDQLRTSRSTRNELKSTSSANISSESSLTSHANAKPLSFSDRIFASTFNQKTSTLALLGENNTRMLVEQPFTLSPAQADASFSASSSHLIERSASTNIPIFSSGQVSDNFIRRNLKKKGSYRQKQKDPRFQHKTRGDGARDGELASEDDEEKNIPDDDKIHSQGKSANSFCASQRTHVSHGLAAMGLDPLQLSLDAIAQQKNNDSTAFSNMKSGAAFSQTASGRPTASRVIKKSRNGSMSDALLEEHAPFCPGHQLATKLLVVKKPGPNKNRRFYTCSYSSDQKCKFFMWAEDNPTLVSLALKITGYISENEHGKGALETYVARLETLTNVELKDEIRRFQRRRILTQRPGEIKLQLCGKRDALLRMLTQEAAAVLGPVLPNSEVDMANQLNEQVALPADCQSSKNKNKSRNDVTKTVTRMATVPKSNLQTARRSNAVDYSSIGTLEVDCSDDEFGLDQESESEDEVDDGDAVANDGSEDGESDEASDDASTYGRKIRIRKSLSSPVYCLGKDPLLDNLRAIFGHSSLRAGQRWAIDRCIDGKSSLLVMPTGSGKSLCYMLPAASLPGITLVVCPLISLMQDQIKKLPPELPAACFSGSPTAYEAAQISQALLLGRVKVLFVSPERLCTPSFRSLMQTLNKTTRQKLGDPTASAISLLCVDEAHCLSQWSYNFRPSFLRIRREVRILEPRAVLALTATAPPHIQRDIMTHLGINSESGLLALPPRRSNLVLSARLVDGDEQKRKAVESIIRGEGTRFSTAVEEGLDSSKNTEGGRMQRANSMKQERKGGRGLNKSLNIKPTIVYVWMRYEVEALSEYLTAVGLPAVGYHAGMDSDKRQRAQQAFMKGSVRIVVATVAFGMGVDKSDVRCVIHSSIPKSVENYLQETGRAGRDGNTAHCHLLLDEDDLEQQHSLSFCTQLSIFQVAALLMRVFVPNAAVTSLVAVRLGIAEKECDLSDASVETILSVLELPPFGLVQVEGVHLDNVLGQFRCTGPNLTTLKSHDPIIKALYVLDKQLSDRDGEYQHAGIKKSHSSIVTSGMGSMATYGFGSSGAEADKDDIADAAAAYGRQPFGPLSLLQLADLSGLTRDECARGLHSLQSRGILEYALSEAAVYLTIVGTGVAEEKWDWNTEQFPATMWRLACRVAETINGITDLASDRTIDMWRLGCTIASKCKTSEVESNAVSRCNEQEQISEFLCQYMQSLSSRDEIPVADKIALDKSVGELLGTFNSSHVPLLRIVDADPGNAITSDKQRAGLTQDINILRQDLRIVEILKALQASVISHNLMKQSLSLNSDLAADVNIAYQKMAALYITRILHGLATPLLPNNHWRGNQFWSKYRKVYFQDVFRIAVEELQKF